MMIRVLVPLAQGFEELEAVTVIDLLRRAEIEVDVAGLVEGPVTGSRGTAVLPDLALQQALERDYDMVVLPGGLPGATHLDDDPRIHRLLQRMAQAGKFIAAICAAPKVLAHAGLLAGKRATCFPGVLDEAVAEDVRVEQGAVVRDDRVITSRGPGTAMDFALELIRALAGEDARRVVESGLQRPASHTATGA